MLSNVSLAIGIAIGLLAECEAVEVRSSTTLWQTGEPANVDNPECGADATKMTAGDVILKVGAAVIDKYVGAPVASTVIDNLDPATKNWLKVRLGLHGGKATCATQCVVFPNGNARLEACLVEDSGAGLQCTTATADYPWGRVEAFSTAATDSGKAKVFCAHGKNWSHDRNRFFYVTANY